MRTQFYRRRVVHSLDLLQVAVEDCVSTHSTAKDVQDSNPTKAAIPPKWPCKCYAPPIKHTNTKVCWTAGAHIYRLVTVDAVRIMTCSCNKRNTYQCTSHSFIHCWLYLSTAKPFAITPRCVHCHRNVMQQKMGHKYSVSLPSSVISGTVNMVGLGNLERKHWRSII